MSVFTNNIAHANTFSLISGQTQLSEEIDGINQSIRLLLTTAKGELFGDPSFGTNLYKFIYDYEGEPLYQLLKSEIVDCLNSQEPRIFIQDSDISIVEDGINLHINLRYNIRYTDYQSTYSFLVSSRKEELD